MLQFHRIIYQLFEAIGTDNLFDLINNNATSNRDLLKLQQILEGYSAQN